MGLPATRYELGTYQGQNATLSLDYRRAGLNYINGDSLIKTTLNDTKYSVSNSLEALEQNGVSVPPGFEKSESVRDGADVFVGYLMFDDLIANNDRHGGNWEVGIDNRGNKYLAPVYDNGASFGCDFGSFVYDNKTPQQYSTEIVSMFGVSTNETYQEAARIRPQAARYWQERLSRRSPNDFVTLFDRIPANQINDKAKNYALELLDYNQSKILGLESSQAKNKDRTEPGASASRRIYLQYKKQIGDRTDSNKGFFSTLARQEKQDIAIAKLILTDSPIEYVRSIINQSDRALSLRANDSNEASNYVENIIVKSRNRNSSPQQNIELD